MGRDSSPIVAAGGWGAVLPRIFMVWASFNEFMTVFTYTCHWDQFSCDWADSSSDETAGKRQDQLSGVQVTRARSLIVISGMNTGHRYSRTTHPNIALNHSSGSDS